MIDSQPRDYRSALYTLTIVFFFWGFIAASNGVFIPFCKTYFRLTQFESQLVDFTFYGGYFIGSLILHGIAQITHVDVLNKIGYKNGVIIGLLLSAVGALMMIPAINAASFEWVLGALFIIAVGFSLQQIVANPFVVALGPPGSGSARLNLANGFNSFGTLIGPIVISLLLFGSGINQGPKSLDIGSINNLYRALVGLFLAIALFYAAAKLPIVKNDIPVRVSPKANGPLLIITLSFLLILGADSLATCTGIKKSYFIYGSLATIVGTLIGILSASRKQPIQWGAMQYPQLIWGMLAIFTYVGVEVTIQSNMGALLKAADFGAYHESNMKQFISLYWGGLMIGRWTGAVGVFNIPKSSKRMLTILVSFVAFGLVLLCNKTSGMDVSGFYLYTIYVVILVATFLFGQEQPAKILLLFGCLGMLTITLGLLTTGTFAIFSLIGSGLCCSIMFPSIFSLSVMGLGKYTSQGSSFLIMMILGGAIIPPVQGMVIDTWNVHISYLVPLLCFLYIAFFAYKVTRVLSKQNIHVH